MNYDSNTQHSAILLCSGTAEELNLLEAHMGIYEDHVRIFEQYSMDEELSKWLEEQNNAVYNDGNDDVYAVEDDDIPF